MKLNVGLLGTSLAWEQLLAQEGVPFSIVGEVLRDEDVSVLVVHRSLSNHERTAVEGYLDSGGALLGAAEYVHGVRGTTTRREYVEYLTVDHDRAFSDIQLIDLAIEVQIPREANCLRTQQQTFAAFAGKLGNGYAVLLPCDPASMMFDIRAANKNFYSTRERLPSERVSLVSKGELQHLLHRALVYLHHARQLPYVHLWYFPDGQRNLFAFRIDTDRGSREDIDALYVVAREEDVGMSWFLDVKSHEDWLQHFAFLSGQEIGVHCYDHQTYDTFDDNVRNIFKAKHKLDQVGVSTQGFSAPFGMWNGGLANAIDDVGFDYSSEFSYAYDTFPLYPSVREKRFRALQIPIHPICIGSLRKAGYSENHMTEYFKRVIDQKLMRDEPLFFYHHPTHHHSEVMRSLFRSVREKGIETVTMGEYARWWRKRLAATLDVSLHDSMLNVEGKGDDSVWLRVIDPSQGEAIVPAANAIETKALVWKTRERTGIPPDIRRIRDFDPRSVLGDLFTRIARTLPRRKG